MQDLTPNDITLKIYNQKVEEYLRHTPTTYNSGHKPLLRWINYSLSQIPEGGSVLEIGSGHGRDARYIREHGFDILCSDGAQAFVNHLNENGQKAVIFNAIKDQPPITECNMVFANAVVPHFTEENLRTVLQKVKKILKADGIFAFNAKQGLGDEWINEKSIHRRFIHYWLPEKLREFVEANGYEVIFLENNIQGGDLPTHTWIHITARKK